MKDDLGGLPSRTVLSKGSLIALCLPHCSSLSVAPQGLQLTGAPRRVDAHTKELDDCNTCVKSQILLSGQTPNWPPVFPVFSSAQLLAFYKELCIYGKYHG
jgi:hypothetical protein